MFDGVSNKPVATSREAIGDRHYMDCINRVYDFPVTVFRMDKDGNRVEATNR